MNNSMTSTNTTNGVPATSTKPVPYQKPVLPPTLPKTYTPSNAAAYRLASLERLTANRQRMLDQQLSSSLAAANGVTESPVIMIFTCCIGIRREKNFLFRAYHEETTISESSRFSVICCSSNGVAVVDV